MPTRISGACNGCRTKKQKCSGDRSGCTQCHAAGIQCTWPEQRKRGPAKGYIEGLEHRLHEAESLLLALLPIISTEQLKCATDILADGSSSMNIPGLKTRDSQSPGPHTMRSSPPVLNKKTGIDYWESFPLDSVDNIRKWQEDCFVNSGSASAQIQSAFRNSIDDSHSHTHILAALNSAPGRHSRHGSVDLTNHGHRHGHSTSQSGGQFRSMSSDDHRSTASTASTPVHMPQHSLSQSSTPNHNNNLQHQSQSNHNHNQAQQTQSSTPNWPSLSLFSPNTNTSSPIAHTSSPNINNINAGIGIGIGAEALLLQSFADSSWAQAQGMSSGMNNMGGGGAMSMEPGPMEVDTGFFTNDMTRRLFW